MNSNLWLTLLSAASLAVFTAGLFLGIQALRIQRQVRRQEERIQWMLSQIERAIEQLSSSEEEAITALQTLSALGGQRSLRHLELARRHWRDNLRVLSYLDEAADRLAVVDQSSKRELAARDLP